MISDNLEHIRRTMNEAARRSGRAPDSIKLLAVSKQVPVALISEAISCGLHLFGENYIQEAADKIPQFGNAARWHFIGHLQSNKARQAVTLFDVIETVDSFKLARLLDTHARALNRSLSILLQVNTGEEPQKSGMPVAATETLARQIMAETNLRLIGLMTIPPYFSDPERSRPYFRTLAAVAADLAQKGLFANANRIELSMGMSGDYAVAIEEGATIVRVGTALFGARTTQGVNA